jgi:hypothetical protein
MEQSQATIKWNGDKKSPYFRPVVREPTMVSRNLPGDSRKNIINCVLGLHVLTTNNLVPFAIACLRTVYFSCCSLTRRSATFEFFIFTLFFVRKR